MFEERSLASDFIFRVQINLVTAVVRIGLKAYVDWAEAYLHTKWHLDPSSRFIATGIGPQLGGGAVPLLGELGPHLTQ